MLTDTILVLIALATAIVGTITNPKPWVKVCIIALACVTGMATLFKAHEDNADKEFVKAALGAELSSTKPTRAFGHVLEESLARVAQKHGLEPGKSITKDAGTLYFFSKKGSDTPVAAFNLSTEDAGDSFVKFVSRLSLDPVLDSAMFKAPNPKDSDQVGKILDEMSFVGNIAIDEDVPWVTTNTDFTFTTTNQPSPLGVTVSAQEGANNVSISLTSDFLDKLMPLAPMDRNWKAYKEFERQLRAPPARQ
jgi:hypothetical protein